MNLASGAIAYTIFGGFTALGSSVQVAENVVVKFGRVFGVSTYGFGCLGLYCGFRSRTISYTLTPLLVFKFSLPNPRSVIPKKK